MTEFAKHFENDGYAVLANRVHEEFLRPVSEEVDRVIDGRANYVPARTGSGGRIRSRSPQPSL